MVVAEPDVHELVRLDGRVAVITGAGHGIGRSIAEHLAAAGAAVCCGDLDEDASEETAATLQQAGRRAIAVRVDVTQPDQVDELCHRAIAELGGIDIVVANAGRLVQGDLASTTPAAWDDGLRVNLTGAFLTARSARPALARSRAGRLILMSSGAGRDPRTVTGLTYAVAKAGIEHLARLLAIDFAGTGVTVNALAPGPVDTAMARSFPDAVLDDYARRSPAGRIGAVEDVARVALFLASDLGSFVNGEVIRVAGGP